MANTYTKLVNHFVFSTFARKPFLVKPMRDDVFAYMGGIIRKMRGAPIAINGVEDHVHILAHVPATIAVADFIRKVKAGSSEWVHDHLGLRRFDWQDGYAAISVRGDDYETVKRYIERQEAHHHSEPYEAELRRTLQAAGIDFDERYLLG